MLYLEEFIGDGHERECYRHPQCRGKCVKVAKKRGETDELRREMRIAQLTAPYLRRFVVDYEPQLTETNKGPGMVCGLVSEPDGTVSPALSRFINEGGAPELIKEGLDAFVRCLIVNDLFFYDFNHGNFVVQTAPDGSKRIRYVDLKSLNQNGYAGFLKMEKFIALFARIIMFRRLRRLYRELGLDFPHYDLCRRKFFSPFFVHIRLHKETA